MNNNYKTSTNKTTNNPFTRRMKKFFGGALDFSDTAQECIDPIDKVLQHALAIQHALFFVDFYLMAILKLVAACAIFFLTLLQVARGKRKIAALFSLNTAKNFACLLCTIAILIHPPLLIALCIVGAVINVIQQGVRCFKERTVSSYLNFTLSIIILVALILCCVNPHLILVCSVVVAIAAIIALHKPVYTGLNVACKKVTHVLGRAKSCLRSVCSYVRSKIKTISAKAMSYCKNILTLKGVSGSYRPTNIIRKAKTLVAIVLPVLLFGFIANTALASLPEIHGAKQINSSTKINDACDVLDLNSEEKEKNKRKVDPAKPNNHNVISKNIVLEQPIKSGQERKSKTVIPKLVSNSETHIVQSSYANELKLFLSPKQENIEVSASSKISQKIDVTAPKHMQNLASRTDTIDVDNYPKIS